MQEDKRSVSSVGLERLLDRQEVTGSNPVILTPSAARFSARRFFVRSARGRGAGGECGEVRDVYVAAN